jgi:hypothetical protein
MQAGPWGALVSSGTSRRGASSLALATRAGAPPSIAARRRGSSARRSGPAHPADITTIDTTAALDNAALDTTAASEHATSIAIVRASARILATGLSRLRDG